MRTFTYLNLYGFLTDAVIVNRIFPAAVGRLLRRLARASAGAAELGDSAPSPRSRCFARPTSRPRSRGRRCSTGWARRCLASATRPPCSTGAWPELAIGDDGDDPPRPALRRQGAISCKKVGLELIVGSTATSGRSCCPPGWPDAARRRPPSRMARWMSHFEPGRRGMAARLDPLGRPARPIRRLTEAAERLVRDAARRPPATRPRPPAPAPPPAAGWQPRPQQAEAGPELEGLVTAAGAARRDPARRAAAHR